MDSSGLEERGYMINSESRLPIADNLPIDRLASIFNNKTNSYKYLFFIALLNLLEESAFSTKVFNVDEIYTEMLTIAWYPHTFFKLNFGSQDKIGTLLDNIKDTGSLTTVLSNNFRYKLRKRMSKHTKEISSTLDRYVKFRLLRPFFQSEVRNLEGSTLHKKIIELSSARTEQFRPLYLFLENETKIVVPPFWLGYISANIKILRNFAFWEWLEYMQKRNPSVPNLQKKLFPPESRETLNNQKKYWKHVLGLAPLSCIFTERPLEINDLSLDHFLPWSFVAHDQLWNLVPVSRSINSSKSNNLPSLHRYFGRFVDLQYKALSIYHTHPGKKSWEKIIEPYITDLKLTERDILDKEKLSKSLEAAITPLYNLARNQGFSPDWIYSVHSY